MRNRLKTWLSRTTNRRIVSAMMIVAIMTGLAKLLVAGKELIIAGHFGTNEILDAFLIAFLLPRFATTAVASSFMPAVMPIYIRVKDKKGLEASKKLFSSIMVLGIVCLVATMCLLAVLAPFALPALASGFTPQTQEASLSLFYWLLPILLLSGIAQLYTTAMNASERFAAVALAPGITPIFAVGALVLFMEDWGIYALAAGTTLGATVELLFLAKLASRLDIPVLPRWNGMNDDIREILRQYAPMVAGAILMSGTTVVDQSMATLLETGSVASLNYANRVIALFLGISALALGSAVLPHYSRLVAAQDWQGLRHTFKTFFRLILLLSIPLAVLLCLFSESVISILFQRGAFSAEDTLRVSQIQALYALQIPFYLIGILIVRLISALKENHILLWGTCISLPLNIVLNYIFMNWIGVAGIALSTTCVYMVSALYLSIMLSRKLPKSPTGLGDDEVASALSLTRPTD